MEGGQQLTRGMDHIFTDNKDDAIVSPFLPPIAPHSLMHNESDPLCQRRSPRADKKSLRVCSAIRYKMQEGSARSIEASLSHLPQCIQVILRSSVKTPLCFDSVKLPHLARFTQICVLLCPE